jgi:hypothetical protein
MWTVKARVKRIEDGALVSIQDEVVFATRSLADNYICEATIEAAKLGNYVTAYLSHPTYGFFHCDPSYWDLLNMRKGAYSEANIR